MSLTYTSLNRYPSMTPRTDCGLEVAPAEVVFDRTNSVVADLKRSPCNDEWICGAYRR